MEKKSAEKIHLRIHKSYRNMISLCDSGILGKKFEEGKMQLDARENFYKGEELDENEIVGVLKKQAIEDSTFNIVGKKSVSAAIKAEIITKENIGKVRGVPFALALL